jgi:SH3-like domain-containing protein
MKLSWRFSLWLLPLAVLLCSGCWRGRHHAREAAYVSAPEAVLRDHVAAVYNKTGTVINGERVEVLERDRRFARVRTASGAEGWVEQRYLVGQKVYDGVQELAKQEQNDAAQASAVTRNSTNVHLTPSREAEHLYQLGQGSKVSILKRATAEKVLPGMPRLASSDKPTPPPVLEDWWLVRDEQGHVGWVLGRLLDVDIPLDIAQYAEGQRIVADFVLDEVQDGDKKVPQYLVLFTEPQDGMPFDYNQIRVFTWNVKRHRYETAYRERGLNGMLPVTVSQENFDKEGMLPVFVLHVKDDAGNIAERKYKLNTPIVRRVLAPGEQASGRATRKARR